MILPDLIAAAAPKNGGFRVSVGDDWAQGRTIYGGLSAALAHEAARSINADLPPLRTAQIAFVGPLADDISARSHLLRRGRNAVSIRTELSGEAGIGLSAVFTFMRARESSVDHARCPAPDVPDPLDNGKMPPPMRRGFAQQFEWRRALPIPTGAAEVSGWIRLKGRDGLDPATEALVVGDSLPAAGMMLFDDFVPLSSVNWTINMLGDAAPSEDGWFLLRSESNHVVDGASSQSMAMWNGDRRPVIAAMQSVVFFG